MVLESEEIPVACLGRGERTNAMLWSWRRALQLSLGITRGSQGGERPRMGDLRLACYSQLRKRSRAGSRQLIMVTNGQCIAIRADKGSKIDVLASRATGGLHDRGGEKADRWARRILRVTGAS